MHTTAVPGDLDTARGPPLRVPLAHFLVALALAAAAATLGVLAALAPDRLPPVARAFADVARAHLLLTGWVCITIMGAMTQFVPVWSGVGLHSRRLARAQLWLVTAGLVGFAACLLAGRLDLLWVAGLGILAGFWTFAYNLARTLAAARPWDSTEAHFAAALGFLALVTAAGLTLAVGFVRPAAVGVDRLALREAHVTLAVLGVVMTTVFGALYQLAPMFTNVDPDGRDAALRRVESVAVPGGVLLLAGGRLAGAPGLARAGAVAAAVGTAAFAVVMGRTIARARAERTPTLTRYALAAPALVAWLALALPAWLRDPLAPGALGGAGARPVLVLGVVGLVVTGTLYHVVPFLVWVEAYSDRIGLADVPAVDDLYDDRLAAADLGCLVASTTLLAAAAGDVGPLAAPVVRLAGSAALLAGLVLFGVNLLLVVRGHVAGGLRGLVPGVDPGASAGGADVSSTDPPVDGGD